MTEVLDDVLESSDESKISELVLLDFSKAFDLYNHQLLSAKLNFLNFLDSYGDLLKSFLLDRDQ